MSAQPASVSTTPPSFVIDKLAEGKLYLFIQVIDEEVKQGWAQYGPLRDTTCHQPPTRLSAADDSPLSSVQMVYSFWEVANLAPPDSHYNYQREIRTFRP